MKQIKYFYIIIIAALISSCDSSINVNEFKYEPKIVVEGYVYPGQPVKNIKLSRNFKVNNNTFDQRIAITPSENSVTASINGIPLIYDPVSESYFTENVVIKYGEKYTLEISADIDGKILTASSSTITPLRGFNIVETDLGDLKFNVDDPTFKFIRARYENEFYVFSIVAENADTNNFIYDHPLFGKIEKADLIEDLDLYKHRSEGINDLSNIKDEIIQMQLSSFHTSFYGRYRVIGYAGDLNFKDYFFTANDVQDLDGNFFAPYIHFNGEAIGVFGSAVTDTLYFNIVK